MLSAGTANTFNLTVNGSTATCVVTPVATASGSHFPWWAGLILGLGLAAILALVLCCLVFCLVTRKRRRKAGGPTQPLQQGSIHGMQGSADPVQAVSPFNVIAATGHKPDDNAMIPKFSSAPEEGNIKPALGLARAGTSSAPPDVYEANMLINASNTLSLAPANMSAASEGSSYSGDLHRRQSSGNERTSAASAASTASQRQFRASAGASAASVPELFRQRSQMPLDEVELGPLLGRGAYGRVFKGAERVLGLWAINACIKDLESLVQLVSCACNMCLQTYALALLCKSSDLLKASAPV